MRIRLPMLFGLVVTLTAFPSVPLPAEALRLEIEPKKSFIAAAVDKRGLLTVFGAGHKHGVLANRWSADLCLDKEQPRNSHARITIPADSLVVDSAEARQRAGLESAGPAESDVREIQARMLGADVLAAETFKEISFETTELAAVRNERWNWRGSITIHGVTKPVSIPVSVVTPDEGHYRMTGSFPVKQSDFGITPVSIAGVVKAKDEIEIRFDLFGELTSRACPSGTQ